MVIFILAWQISATMQSYLQTYAPTNIAIAWLRTRRGVKWALLAALVATPIYAWAASALVKVIDDGGPPWLGFMVMLCVWNALKFAINALLTPFVFLRFHLIARRERSVPRLGQPGAEPMATRGVEYMDRRG